MTMPLTRLRFQIAIPAQGMIEIRDALTDLLKEYGTDDLGWFHSSIFVILTHFSAFLFSLLCAL